MQWHLCCEHPGQWTQLGYCSLAIPRLTFQIGSVSLTTHNYDISQLPTTVLTNLQHTNSSSSMQWHLCCEHSGQWTLLGYCSLAVPRLTFQIGSVSLTTQNYDIPQLPNTVLTNLQHTQTHLAGLNDTLCRWLVTEQTKSAFTMISESNTSGKSLWKPASFFSWQALRKRTEIRPQPSGDVKFPMIRKTLSVGKSCTGRGRPARWSTPKPSCEPKCC